MAGEEEDEEQQSTTTGRPNAWWARQRERLADEQKVEAFEPDNFGSDYRGVKNLRGRGGAARVKPEDTIGDDAACWCGLPLDHDWPGKASGRKHPKGNEMPTDTMISRGELRAYHADLQEVVIHAVNTYGCKYRMANNSIMLYPPDGSRPFNIYARNSDKQVRSARSWFMTHVLMLDDDGNPQNPLIKDGTIVIDDFARKAGIAAHREVNDEEVRRLAAQLNSPEHIPPPPAPKAHRAEPAIEFQDTPAKPEDYMPPQPERSLSEPEWEQHEHKGRVSPNYLSRIRDGVREYLCITCRDEGNEWITDKNNALGGHFRANHTDTSDLYSPETRARAGAKASATKAQKRRQEVLAYLAHELGVDLPDKSEVAEVERLRKQIDVAARQVHDLTIRAEEAEAKLALIREASGL